ncbi:unnamed protein product [Symbiodinium sp. CCMP2456]|nr:unnamed protein product [Symbiodinium sp. CCMP2456]
MASIFGHSFDFAQLSAPSIPSSLIPENFLKTAASSSSSAAPSASWQGTLQRHSSCAQLVKARPDKSFIQLDDDKRTKALFIWAEFLSPILASCLVGRMILCHSSEGTRAEKVIENLNAIFGRKAASTIYSRALAAIRYQHFCTSFPMSELLCWRYVNQLATGKPTAASSFLRLCVFLHYTLGPDGSEEVINSARLSGQAALALNRKAPTKQAPPFSVSMVRTLHAILKDNSRSPFDRLAAGSFLCAIYGRCRWSDLRHIETIVLDIASGRRHGFVEILTKHHKTAKKDAAELLPIVAPAFGITGDCWALTFVNLRNELLGERASLPGPLLPAVSSEQPLVFLQRPLEADEATSFLQFLLAQFPDIKQWTSHSCKETPLSWLAKAGADKSTLDFMGRHVGSITSSDIYARGMQSRPLRKLVITIKMIYVGTFDPDATRSGMFLHDNPQASAPSAVRSESSLSGGIGSAEEQEQNSQQASKASSDSESSSSSSASSSIRPQIAVPRGQPPHAQAFVRPKGKVHLRATPEATRFKCGRVITNVFVPVDADSYMRSALCGQCEPTAFPIKTTSDMLAALDAALKRRKD